MGKVAQPWHPSPTGEAGTQQPSAWLTLASWDLRTCASPEGASPSCPALPEHPHLLPSLPHRSPQALFVSKVFLPSPFAVPAPSQPWGTRGCRPQPQQVLRMVPPWLPPLPPQALRAASSTPRRWGLRQGKTGLENSVGLGWELNKPNCCPLTCIAAAPHLHLGIIDSEHPAPGDTHICRHLHVSDVISAGSRDVEVALSITSIKTCLGGQGQRVERHH